MTVVRNFDRGAYDNLAAFSVKVKTIRGPWKRNVDNGAADASCAGQRNYEIRHAVSLSPPLLPSFPFLDTIKCHFAKERKLSINHARNCLPDSFEVFGNCPQLIQKNTMSN